ncbi:hypothetical protein M501DRAFT_954611 [Patellaria atrata CBS 101060]|uniref:DH domain-containing protein n=1 Tax=Patellaria atrata CBS 101060 TaxID=1346257 RepID=A0A9P4SCK1_9PEZI|nr:hypothetical protein M501DRAFT_954611 [Patellaria atrata CBS 101060]
MASVLSIPPVSPFKRSFSDDPHLRPSSALTDNASNGTVRHNIYRMGSPASVTSFLSLQTNSRQRMNENIPLSANSRTSLSLGENAKQIYSGRHLISPTLSESSWITGHLSLRTLSQTTPSKGKIHNSPKCAPNTVQEPLVQDLHLLEAPSPVSILSITGNDSSKDDQSVLPVNTQPNNDPVPFKRWISILRKRNTRQLQEPVPPNKPSTYEHQALTSGKPHLRTVSSEYRRHRKSGSFTSSLAFVTAVKSASITLASTSLGPFSRRTGRTGYVRSDNRSSGFSEVRLSMDSAAASVGHILDEAAWGRSIKRRKILEELIASEEGYIGDLKVLVNVYFTLLATVISSTTWDRLCIQRSMAQILDLHEELLGELQKAVPHSEYTMHETKQFSSTPRPKHTRWRSDVIPYRSPAKKVRMKHRHSLDGGGLAGPPRIGDTADTKTVRDVARVFGRFTNRFFAYEAYGAQYETMLQDLESTHKLIPTWHSYEKGIEALSNSLNPAYIKASSGKRGLTFADLLIKPIQRVCRYPLLLNDLLKQTPVCDDPEAHTELDKTLSRFQEITNEIDKATDDPKTRRLIETTWLLQDRLIIEDSTTSPAVILRTLGHVILCGVLHVAYQTVEKTKGQYMVCILYKSRLILATASKRTHCYTVVAGIRLANASIEDSDNGKGLQCHTAPFTWKLVFESSNRLFELILSGCSAKEEEQWKSHLAERISVENRDSSNCRTATQDFQSTLISTLKPIGSIYGQFGNFTRRLSMQRASTLGPKGTKNQVIIKNTHAQNINSSPTNSLSVNRSQSHLSPAHVPTLAPRRAERTRLETSLADVWTKDVLPYPAMAPKRPDNPIRASANSVMRKLSMASITSSFTKRSASYSSMRSENSYDRRKSQNLSSSKRHSHHEAQPARTKPVDFHNSPSAFLPADFDLQRDQRNRLKKYTNRSLGIEQRSSPSPALSKDAAQVAPKKERLPTPDPRKKEDPKALKVVQEQKQPKDMTEPGLKKATTIDFKEQQKPLKIEERDTPSQQSKLSTGKSKGLTKSRSKMFRFFL